MHAATLVTAGAVLLFKIHTYYLSTFSWIIFLIGFFSFVYYSISAYKEIDFKTIVAYSTSSQIGFVFMLLGIGYNTVALFYMILHAFFKAFIFWSVGFITHMYDNQYLSVKIKKQINFILLVTIFVGFFSLLSFPFFSIFYIKETSFLFFNNFYYVFVLFILVGQFFSILYSIRIFYQFIPFQKRYFIDSFYIKNFEIYIILFILTVVSFFILLLVTIVFAEIFPIVEKIIPKHLIIYTSILLFFLFFFLNYTRPINAYPINIFSKYYPVNIFLKNIANIYIKVKTYIFRKLLTINCIFNTIGIPYRRFWPFLFF